MNRIMNNIHFINKQNNLKKINFFIKKNVNSKTYFYDGKYLSFQKNIQKDNNLSIGFIILRHVNSKITNNYWIKCHNCIRRFYPNNKILIIDDNSNPLYLSNLSFSNTTIINSEFPGRGELLPYYYYLNNKLFDKAVIIHDSVFINKFIDFDVDDYKLLWSFEQKHNNNYKHTVLKLLNIFNDVNLINFYNSKLWRGCFGAMTIITHDYLTFVNNKYNLHKLIGCINNRRLRMCFERVIACLLQIHKPYKCLLDIHHYCPWETRIYNINQQEIKRLPIIKVWTGR